MKETWEKALDEIDVYQIHPEFKPFIGKLYCDSDKRKEHSIPKILQVGESHYIDRKYEEESQDDFPLQYFEQWWTDPCKDFTVKYGSWYKTRRVIKEEFLDSQNSGRGLRIFSGMLEVFEKVYRHQEVTAKDGYQFLSYMNFFPMPALYKGKGIRFSLELAARKQGEPDLALTMWDKVAEVATDTLDAVIDIIDPDIVIFTSAFAYDTYREKHGKNPKFIRATHPCSQWWEPRRSEKDGLTGKERLTKQLEELRDANKLDRVP